MTPHSQTIKTTLQAHDKVCQAEGLLDLQLGIAETFAAAVGDYGDASAKTQLETLLCAAHAIADARWAIESYAALLAYEEPDGPPN